jgi:hypothetical protein
VYSKYSFWPPREMTAEMEPSNAWRVAGRRQKRAVSIMARVDRREVLVGALILAMGLKYEDGREGQGGSREKGGRVEGRVFRN